MKESTYFADFRKALGDIGLKKNDIVYVSSDVTSVVLTAMKELGFKGRDDRERFLNTLIDVLQEVVGPEGTLLFPVYNWDFCKGVAFDIKTTQGQVGSLNNYILNTRNDFARTKHPLYSLMVWGKDADRLVNMDNQDSWGSNSPFAYLHHNGGKELCLNVNATQGMTFKHYVEQSLNVPYRYQKFFMGEYTDIDGCRETRVYSMYVRRLEVTLTPSQTTDFFVRKGCCNRTTFRGMDMAVIDLPGAYDALSDDLLHNGGHNVYEFENYSIDWDAARDDAYQMGFLKNRDRME